LRVIKNNTLRYQAFYKSLPCLPDNKVRERNPGFTNSYFEFNENLNKIQLYFSLLLSLQNKVKELPDSQSILTAFENVVKKIISFKELNIFLFDNAQLTLIPVVKKNPDFTTDFINKAYKEGVLDWVFESLTSPKIIPELNQYKSNGIKLSFITFPLVSDMQPKGVLTILSPMQTFSGDSIEAKIIISMTEFVYSKIELIKKNEELNSAYKDQQLYQSKLLNDYRLSAVGELTNGIAEEILSPLQVITSHIDLLNDEIDYSSSEIIKNQVNKLESIVHRLVKFASLNNDKIKIYPCDLNKLIEEYYNLLSSTLVNNNYECILDLADTLPPVLSNPGYIFQILANVFSLINSSGKKGGGILIQTRFVDDKIFIRIVATEFISSVTQKDDDTQFNLKIIYNLMKKHEGELKISGKETAGSVIVLAFPFKRRIR